MNVDKLMVKLFKLINQTRNPRAYDLNITIDEFNKIVDEAVEKDFISNAIWKAHLNKYVIHEKTYVTEKGQQFILENKRFKTTFTSFFKSSFFTS